MSLIAAFSPSDRYNAERRGPRCFDGFNVRIFNGLVGLIWLKRYSFCVRIGLLFAW